MELDVHRPLLLAPGEGETVTDRPERTLRILAEVEKLIVTWFRYEPGEVGPDPHIHRRHTDAFYLLEGELEFTLGPDLERPPPGRERSPRRRRASSTPFATRATRPRSSSTSTRRR